MRETCSRRRRRRRKRKRKVIKQHNNLKNRINALDSSLELRTIGSLTTFIEGGRCAGVDSTNTTSGSQVILM